MTLLILETKHLLKYTHKVSIRKSTLIVMAAIPMDGYAAFVIYSHYIFTYVTIVATVHHM